MTSVGIGVVVVDDHPVVLAGLGALLAAEPDIDVVGTARSVADTLALPEQLAPSVCVVDLRLPDGDGIALASTLKRRWPDTRVLILTLTADPAEVVRSLGAGLDGYVLKDSEPSELVSAVRAVAHGSTVLGQGASAPVVRAAGSLPDPSPLAALDAREREILSLMARGLGAATIAARLHLAPKTVRNRTTEIVRRLGVADRDEAAALARAHGLAHES